MVFPSVRGRSTDRAGRRSSGARVRADDPLVRTRLGVLLLILVAGRPGARRRPPLPRRRPPPDGRALDRTAGGRARRSAGPSRRRRTRTAPATGGSTSSAPPGSPVLAAGDGVVAFAGMVAGRPVVSIDHANGLRTTYEPVDPSVGAGQAVARGSPIGTLTAGHAGLPGRGLPALGGAPRARPTWTRSPLLRPPRIRLLPMELTGSALPRRAVRRCRRAWCAGGARPWCASGRCGSRSRRARGRCRPGSGPRSSRG